MMKTSKIHKALLICLLFFTIPVIGQVKVKLEKAESLRGTTINGQMVNKVKGNVVFKQENTVIYCDSAYIFKDQNTIEAFGHLKIEDDSTVITSAQGVYNGNTRVASLRNNVIFKQKKGVTLYTDNLDYDRIKRIASYKGGGRLVDSTNVLTSQRGYFDENSRMASFAKNVKGKSPEMTMTSDTMQYNSYSKIVYFKSKTLLVDNEQNKAQYETGYYNTITKKSSLRSGQFETTDYYLEGNDLELDDFIGVYTATGNVLMTAKEEDIILTGNQAVFDKPSGKTKIFGQPIMKRIMAEGDTLFLRADTLVSVERHDTLGGNLLIAYPSVSIYKSDLQGKMDSLVYVVNDSVLNIFKDPIIWTQGSQMTADTMSMVMRNGTIDKMIMTSDGFIISQDTLKLFNQIKGRMMTTYFKNDIIDRVSVTGNGESIYFVSKEEERELTGMNKVICSSMLIRFKENMVHKITFYSKSDGDFYPPKKITSETMQLNGFKWRVNEKPTKQFVLRLERAPASVKESKPKKESLLKHN